MEADTPSDGRRWSPVTVAVAVAASVAVPFVVTEPIELNRISRLLVLVVAVLAVNLLTGFTGLVSLGHGVFVGFGAFAMANLVDTGLSLFICVVLASALTGVVGVALGAPAIRVRGLYLALITFGFALAFQPLARRMGSWTGGVTGREVVNDSFRPPSVLGIDEHTHIWRYGWCLVTVAVWFVLARNLVNSRAGRALRAIRDDETAAANFGINVRSVKLRVLAVSAAMAGTAGAMQAILNPFVSNDDFDAFFSLRLYAAAVLGGLGMIAGAVWGVLALIAVPTANRALGWFENEAIVFGAGLIIVTFVAPDGIAGLLRRTRQRLRNTR